MENMTILTQGMYEKASQVTTIEDAVHVLCECGTFRTTESVLRSFAGCDNPRKLLVDGLSNWNPHVKRESLDRNVRNWLNGNNQITDKRTAFILSRILELDLERADAFLKMLIGEGIHWRDPEDIVWGYAIRQKLGPDQVYRLLEQAKKLVKHNDTRENTAPEVYTAEIWDQINPVLYSSEDALLRFIQEQSPNLGVFHNTAFSIFSQYMDLLERGFKDSDIESNYRPMTQKEKQDKEADEASRKETAEREAKEKGVTLPSENPNARKTLASIDGDVEIYAPDAISTRDILETYLYRKLIPSVKQKNEPYHAIQSSIRQNWPDEAMLSKMRNRKLDVSRKVLILLFLATDGDNSDFSDSEEDWDEEESCTANDVFLSIYMRLNLMLRSCGFQELDPRSPFDWLILFCLCAGGLWETDFRLHDLLQAMFPDD